MIKCKPLHPVPTAPPFDESWGKDNYTIKTEIDTLFSNIDLNTYYIKTEIDTLFSNIDLSNYYTKSDSGPDLGKAR